MKILKNYWIKDWEDTKLLNKIKKIKWYKNGNINFIRKLMWRVNMLFKIMGVMILRFLIQVRRSLCSIL
jgi:hypothetical protein